MVDSGTNAGRYFYTCGERFMRSLYFFQKEWQEIIKTPKWIVLTSVFLLFGIASPIAAKYMNELVAGIGELQIQLPEATIVDSYLQFFKNMYGLSILVVMMTFMSTVVEEKVRGSVLLVLTKGLSRSSFLLQKFLASVLFFTLVYTLSIVAHLYYTSLLFPMQTIAQGLIPFLLFWIYGVVLLSVTLLCSTISKTHTLAAVASFVSFIVVSFSNQIPKIGKFLPGSLQSLSIEMITQNSLSSSLGITVFCSLLLAIAIVVLTTVLFARQEL